MSSGNPSANPIRVRREPPAFRRVTVRRVEPVSPRLTRITVGGPELDGFAVEEPAASVRVLLPVPGEGLVLPTWNGNEFLLPGGGRPPIRTLTPRRADTAARELDVEVVLHGSGPAARFATTAAPGDDVAVSGPGRGYTIAGDAAAFLLAGDESALPAIAQLLEMLPATIPVDVHVEVAQPDARIALPGGANANVAWHDLDQDARAGDALVAAVRDAVLPEGVRIWVAGEAAAVQRIRRSLFDERGFPRDRTTIRGYWKLGRAGADEA